MTEKDNLKVQLKKLAEAIAKHFPEPKFIEACLYALKTEDERKKLINFLDKTENLTKTDINIKILEIIEAR